ncbi:hypothetical protein H0H92_015995, partial [Tricholoma furcatifolium]
DFINDADSEPEENPVHEHAADDDAESLGSEFTDDEHLDFSDPTTASHAAVMQLMTVEEANEALNAYFELEQRKLSASAREEPHPDDRHWYPDPVPEEIPAEKIPDGIVPLLPRPDFDKFLWRVAVR